MSVHINHAVSPTITEEEKEDIAARNPCSDPLSCLPL